LKKWIDPKTGNKVVVVAATDVLSTLQASIDIENIPRELGGNLLWKPPMGSSLDAGICRRLDWIIELGPTSTLPPGPMKWVVDDKGVRTAVAVGSMDGKVRQEPIAVLNARRDSRKHMTEDE
jgi:hypothetical protein